MTSNNRLDDSLRCRFIGRLEAGQSQAEVVRWLQVSRKWTPTCEINTKLELPSPVSDESKCIRQRASRRVFIWRESGNYVTKINTLEEFLCGVAEWRAVVHPCMFSMRALSTFRANGMRSWKPMGGSSGCLEYIFMYENALPHRIDIVDELNEGMAINGMDSSSRSPDLNPIAWISDGLGKAVSQRSSLLKTLKN
ncbi:hypothetical protein TNCV_1199321 [Trichonephila clavipes]|uniref:Uncharacterized protein n=1 Tax=Trichonephila clavipes TaxID=2585209 RepID=A0A8X6RZP7_TRICX|nr:hypothetical protein TNCV_1199321 [Trichonephila clavipes]